MNNMLEQLQPIPDAIQAAGGQPLIVGGAVRDILLGHPPKDLDFEVYQLDVERLAMVLAPFGRIDAVGRSFGVLKLRTHAGQEFDFALPRRESKVGTGHRGFLAAPDPTMTPQEAAARRDFTINAMALTPDGQVLDFFGGQEDLRARILRHTTTAFAEDPLRVLRGMQFAARFDMRLAPETAALCRQLLPEAPTLAIERVWAEWWKWATQGARPSAGLRVLEQTGWISLYPELAALVGCEQDPVWHPEGWSIVELAGEAHDARTTQSIDINSSSPSRTFWEFVTSTTAAPAMVPGLRSTSSAQTLINALVDGVSITDPARPDSFSSRSSLNPAAITNSEGLIWAFGATAVSADKVIRVVFKIPLRHMKSIMLTAVDDFEIVRRVVHPVAIYVMNMLPTFQGATDLQFHNDPVNSDSTILARPGSVYIPTIVVDARTSPIDGDVLFYFDLAVVGNSDIAHVFDYTTRLRVFQVQVGDVWTHTLHVCDVAAAIAKRDGLEGEQRAALLFAALCHDLGKPTTTRHDPDGHIRSPGHDQVGVAMAEALLRRLGAPHDIIAQVGPLVREHMVHIGMTLAARSVRRLALRLAPATIEQWGRLVEADASGRPPLPPAAPGAAIVEYAQQLSAAAGPPAPVLLGRHLIAAGMMQPGPALGALLKQAYQAQIDGVFATAEEGMDWAARELQDAARIEDRGSRIEDQGSRIGDRE
jgi:putative nucleotidyltransferase with HDIG domain